MCWTDGGSGTQKIFTVESTFSYKYVSGYKQPCTWHVTDRHHKLQQQQSSPVVYAPYHTVPKSVSHTHTIRRHQDTCHIWYVAICDIWHDDRKHLHDGSQLPGKGALHSDRQGCQHPRNCVELLQKPWLHHPSLLVHIRIFSSRQLRSASRILDQDQQSVVQQICRACISGALSYSYRIADLQTWVWIFSAY